VFFHLCVNFVKPLSSRDPESQTGLCCKSSSNWTIANWAIANGQLLARAHTRGVRSLKFFTPTPLLLRLNILRHHSDSDALLSLGLRLLLQLPSECHKLLAVSKRPYPVFALKRLKKRLKRNCRALQNM